MGHIDYTDFAALRERARANPLARATGEIPQEQFARRGNFAVALSLNK